MIYTDSRYATGRIFKAHDSRTGLYQTSVTRIFPTSSANYYIYVWKEGDRIDLVAHKLYANAEYWWTILDYNPEIADALNIAPGTELRVPVV
jgi:hypothetical protein